LRLGYGNMLSGMGAFTYRVRERKTAEDSRPIGSYSHAAGQDPPLVVAIPESDEHTTGPNILFVEPFADPG
jgi:hypothetical protein